MLKPMKVLLALALLACVPATYAALGPYSASGDMGGSAVVMAAQKTNSSQVYWPGGIGTFIAVGTWNAATLTLEVVGPDGTSLVPVGSSTTFTANGVGTFYLPKCLLQAVVSSAGGSTSLTASIGLVQASPR